MKVNEKNHVVEQAALAALHHDESILYQRLATLVGLPYPTIKRILQRPTDVHFYKGRVICAAYYENKSKEERGE